MSLAVHLELYTPQPLPVALDTAGRYICELMVHMQCRSPLLWLPQDLEEQVEISASLTRVASLWPAATEMDTRARALALLIGFRGRSRVVIG